MSDSPIPNANAASLSTPATSAMSSNASSRRSSISSSATPGIRPIPAAAGASASTAASASTRRLQQTADPLSRDYPKPEGEIDVAEALSREPPKWTLGYWSKNAPELRTPPLSPKTSQKRLEDTKRELRQAHNDMATKMSKR